MKVVGQSNTKAPTATEIRNHLQKQGVEITLENAEEVLQLLSFLAKLIVKQNILK